MSDSLRRGFKSEAERRALKLRGVLDLTAYDCLDPLDLAEHLGVLVASLADLRGEVESDRSIDTCLGSRSGFSAVTVSAGERHLIVFNPYHPPGRQANSVVHELSHIILKHDASSALGPWGCREWDQTQEEEADWQAATLLVPRPGALWWLENGGGIEGGAEHFGVSRTLFRWRVNQTGVARQIAARRHRSPSLSDSIREVTRGARRREKAGSLTQSKRRPPARLPIARLPSLPKDD